MAKTVVLEGINSGYMSANTISVNFQKLNDNFDGFVSRNGDSPNYMESDFDLNGNDLLNGGSASFNSLSLAGANVTSLVTVPNWKGSWVTSTSYVVNDLVKSNGDVYICLVAHTSGTFSTDLSNSYWELFVQRGSAGAGTGDMLAANNLSDVANTSLALSNIGAQPASAKIPFTDVSTTWTQEFKVQNFKLNITQSGATYNAYLQGFSSNTFEIGVADSSGTPLTGTSNNAIQMTFDSAGVDSMSFWHTGAQAAVLDPAGANEAATDDSIITREKIKPSMKGRTGLELVETTYDSSVDGVVASVESASFEDGYEYLFYFEGVSHNDASSRRPVMEIYKDSDLAYHTTALNLQDAVTSSQNQHGTIELFLSRTSGSWKYALSKLETNSTVTAGTDDGETLEDIGDYNLKWSLATAQKISKVRFSWSSGSFDSGVIKMYRFPIVS